MYHLRMNASTPSYDFSTIKEELRDNRAIAHCAAKYGNTGDPTSMRTCYLLRHYPELSVSQIAQLMGVSVSAASRCLKRLSHSEVVVARKEGKTMFYALNDNDFTQLLITQLEGRAA
jgi:Fic family protein